MIYSPQLPFLWCIVFIRLFCARLSAGIAIFLPHSLFPVVLRARIKKRIVQRLSKEFLICSRFDPISLSCALHGNSLFKTAKNCDLQRRSILISIDKNLVLSGSFAQRCLEFAVDDTSSQFFSKISDTLCVTSKGLLIWARLSELARFPRSRLTTQTFVKISMCSYERMD